MTPRARLQKSRVSARNVFDDLDQTLTEPASLRKLSLYNFVGILSARHRRVTILECSILRFLSLSLLSSHSQQAMLAARGQQALRSVSLERKQRQEV